MIKKERVRERKRERERICVYYNPNNTCLVDYTNDELFIVTIAVKTCVVGACFITGRSAHSVTRTINTFLLFIVDA